MADSIFADSLFVRHDDNLEWVHRIVSHLENNNQVALQIQLDTSAHMSLQETAAGTDLFAEPESFIENLGRERRRPEGVYPIKEAISTEVETLVHEREEQRRRHLFSNTPKQDAAFEYRLRRAEKERDFLKEQLEIVTKDCNCGRGGKHPDGDLPSQKRPDLMIA